MLRNEKFASKEISNKKNANANEKFAQKIIAKEMKTNIYERFFLYSRSKILRMSYEHVGHPDSKRKKNFYIVVITCHSQSTKWNANYLKHYFAFNVSSFRR